MDIAPSFSFNTSKVNYELFEDEVIIINFDSGKYYSLDKTGMVIWQLIEQGLNMSQILHALNARYTGEAVAIQKTTKKYINDLLLEGLIIPGEADSGALHQNCLADFDKTAFVAPALNIFDDMQELLLLDTMYDVDETGWPHKK